MYRDTPQLSYTEARRLEDMLRPIRFAPRRRLEVDLRRADLCARCVTNKPVWALFDGRRRVSLYTRPPAAYLVPAHDGARWVWADPPAERNTQRATT
jgi:hypothetical protein